MEQNETRRGIRAESEKGVKMGLGKFVIYGIPRVGSNYFISQLNLHPEIICHYEVFHPKAVYYGFGDKKVNVQRLPDAAERDADSGAFLDLLWSENGGCTHVGYNLFPDHNPNVIAQSVMDASQKKIILKRKGNLKNFISLKVAQKTGIWSSKAEEKLGKKLTTEEKAIVFDAQEFSRYLRHVNRFYSNLENNIALAGQDYMVVYYEDFIRRKQAMMDSVFSYLGAGDFELPAEDKFTVQNKESMAELVRNHDELRRYLDSGFHDFFAE